MTRLPSFRRAATAMLSLPLTAVVCLAPLPALADGSIADSSLQLRSPLTTAPLGAKLRMYVTLQDPVEGEAAPPSEAPPVAAEGAAPAPNYPPPPPPGYYGPPPPPQNKPPRGIGMLVTGAVLTGAVALPAMIGGVYIIAVGRAADEASGDTGIVEAGGNIAGGFFLVFGILALGAGVPLLAIGGVRMKRYNDWKSGQQVRLMPSSGRTVHGTWTAGFKMQF
jgi:hypothetical protein